MASAFFFEKAASAGNAIVKLSPSRADGTRLAEQRAHHRVLLPDGLGDRAPDGLDPVEVERRGRACLPGSGSGSGGTAASGSSSGFATAAAAVPPPPAETARAVGGVRARSRGGAGASGAAAAAAEARLELLDPEQQRLERQVGLRLRRLQQRELELDPRLGAVLDGGDRRRQ